MTEPASTPTRAPFLRRLPGRKPIALAAAALIGAGLLGTVLVPDNPVAPARAETSAGSVVTPFGRAPLSFADLVEKVRPAVVSISVKNGSSTREGRGPNHEFRGLPDLPDDHPLNEFFKRFRGQPGPMPQPPRLAQGSGFIFSADGYVVTNNHVVDEASAIEVTMDNGDKHDAELIGTDSRTDLAVLKIKSGGPFPAVEFADKPARVGDWVLAVGNPFGLGGTVTAGIVSAHNRDIGSGPYDYLQIDAAVNRGNSGGPSFNLDGKVVGVNTAIFSPSGGNVGIAFAVPAELAKKVVTQLQKGGTVSRGWLGVTIQNLNEDLADSLGLKEPKGSMITKITPDGPAAKAKLAVGDVIVKVDGEAIEDSRDLARKVAAITPNTDVKVEVVRDGKNETIDVKLGTFPSGKKLAAIQSGKPTGEQMEELGLSLAPASSQMGPGEPGVVIIDVDPAGKGAEKGLKAGDVILKVAGEDVSMPEDVVNGIKKAKDKGRSAVNMLVRSGEQQRFIAIPLKKV